MSSKITENISKLYTAIQEQGYESFGKTGDGQDADEEYVDKTIDFAFHSIIECAADTSQFDIDHMKMNARNQFGPGEAETQVSYVTTSCQAAIAACQRLDAICDNYGTPSICGIDFSGSFSSDMSRVMDYATTFANDTGIDGRKLYNSLMRDPQYASTFKALSEKYLSDTASKETVGLSHAVDLAKDAQQQNALDSTDTKADVHDMQKDHDDHNGREHDDDDDDLGN